ncbi:MAG: HAD-IA family hydrolase [Bacteroidota bacterium]
MRKSLLIFDFDGTIADTLVVAEQVLNETGREFGLPRISRQQLMEFKHKSIPELLKLSGLSWIQLPSFVKKLRSRFKSHAKQVNPIQGMPEILSTLKTRGYRMEILTSNAQEVVQCFLQDHDLSVFEFVHAPDSIFGKSKALKNILKRRKLSASQVVMIGDELRDVEAAQKVGMESIAVTWGFNSEQLLRKGGANHIVTKPDHLLQLL